LTWRAAQGDPTVRAFEHSILSGTVMKDVLAGENKRAAAEQELVRLREREEQFKKLCECKERDKKAAAERKERKQTAPAAVAKQLDDRLRGIYGQRDKLLALEDGPKKKKLQAKLQRSLDSAKQLLDAQSSKDGLERYFEEISRVACAVR
jgi:hypothetical protein